MNTKDVSQMLAGRELDALVAEQVMGWKECTWPMVHSHLLGEKVWHSDTNRFSTDIAAAWKVLEKLDLILWPEVGRMNDGHWYCEIVHGAPEPNGVHQVSRVVAETAPLAICRATLKAVAP